MIKINFEKLVVPELSITKPHSYNYYLPSKNGKFYDELKNYYNLSSTHSSLCNVLSLKLRKNGKIVIIRL